MSLFKLKKILIILLLLCLLDMPYGYYQLVRYITAFSFGWFAYEANINNDKNFIFYVAIAVLFQPFIKIPLGRVIWNIVDVILAGYLLYDIKITGENRKSNH